MKAGDFLRVALAHQPEESLRAFMDPLADALCCAAKWLKSSITEFSEIRVLRGHALRCGSWHHTHRWEGFDPLGS